MAGVLAVGFMVSVQPAVTAEATASVPVGPWRIHKGAIDGARYTVVVPKQWNRTLVLYSHGLYPEGYPEPGVVELSNHPQTAQWLLDNGYAVAASEYKGKHGYAMEPAQSDQIALLNWFEQRIGKPRRTLSTGQSMGGGIAAKLAERNPGRFSGVATMCAVYDFVGYMNSALDLTFATRTLLAPGKGIDLVKAKDAAASTQALSDAVDEALKTPQGRARLALTGALGNVPAWNSTYDPKPTEVAERIRQQAAWVQGAYTWGHGPAGRAELEQRAGGNPSWNTGVDYAKLLARSSERGLVARAYRDAGLDGKRGLSGDLAKLASAPRISADPNAVSYLRRYGVLDATTPAPTLALHTVGDGGAPASAQRWYAGQVRRTGDPSKLRQVYSNRGMHCAFTASEEIVMIRTLERRLDTGRWPSTSPALLNRAASAFPSAFQTPADVMGGTPKPVGPAFTHFTPPMPPRPSR